MKKFILLALLIATPLAGQRDRHVQEEWNTDAVNLEQNVFSATDAWHVSPWLGGYYQTGDWWMYPESDGSGGVWLYWPIENGWIWTNRDVYPLAWNTETQQWFNSCEL
jgi:hypothetical protein